MWDHNFTDFSNNFHITTKEIKFLKFEDSFQRKSGIVYVDNSSKEYSYQDLSNYFTKEDPVNYLFEILSGNSPEKEMELDYHFKKCSRCGNWIFSKDQTFFSKRADFICERCTPVKSRGKIKLWKDPYDDDRKFYTKRTAVFKPGVTTLIGCNGIGKSTLLRNVKEELAGKGIPFLMFDNLGNEGGEKSLGEIFSGTAKLDDDDPEFTSIDYAISLFSSSEGEKIKESFIRFTKRMIKQINLYKGYGEMWLLFDALDSGLSLDVIQDIKEYIFANILKDAPEGMDIYIILSSNSFEMSEDTMGFSVEKMKYIPIKSFSQFKKAVLSSVLYKEKRDTVLRLKYEINHRPYEFSFDEEIASEYPTVKIDQDCAEMILGDFRLVLHLWMKKRSSRKTYHLYKKEGDIWKEIPCRDMEKDEFGSLRRNSIEKEMHEYLCRRVFLQEK